MYEYRKKQSNTGDRVQIEDAKMQNSFDDFISYDKNTGLFTWKVSKGSAKKGHIAGSKTTKGYLSVRVNGNFVLCHRLAWFFEYGVWPSFEIDHINENKQDNRIVNLRDVDKSTNLQNQANCQLNNKSGKRGIHWDKKKNKWVAQFSVNGKKRHIGYFDDAEEAYKNYLIKKQQLPNAVVRSNV